MKEVIIDGVKYVPSEDDGKIKDFQLEGNIIKIKVFCSGDVEIENLDESKCIYISTSLKALYEAVELSKKRFKGGN